MDLSKEANLVSSGDFNEDLENRNEHLSEQIFEMCQMFSQQRPEIDEFAQGFNILATVK